MPKIKHTAHKDAGGSSARGNFFVPHRSLAVSISPCYTLFLAVIPHIHVVFQPLVAVALMTLRSVNVRGSELGKRPVYEGSSSPEASDYEEEMEYEERAEYVAVPYLSSQLSAAHLYASSSTGATK